MLEKRLERSISHQRPICLEVKICPKLVRVLMFSSHFAPNLLSQEDLIQPDIFKSQSPAGELFEWGRGKGEKTPVYYQLCLEHR